MTPWQEHKEKWKDCTDCSLCKRRKNVVLLRGDTKAEILFVGEAPGESEDVEGRPFHGPAGKLLDKQIDSAGIRRFKLAFTNLVACIPKGEKKEGQKKSKLEEPPKEAIEACRDRLVEIIDIIQPKVVVMVGKLSEKWTPDALTKVKFKSRVPYVTHIIHPSAILQADESQKGLAHQQSIVTLKNLVDEL